METQQRKRHVSEIKQVEVVNIASPTMRSTSREISSSLTTVRTSSINKRKLYEGRSMVIESMTNISVITVKFEATRIML